MELLAKARGTNAKLFAAVLDFRDAFFQVPVTPAEMPFLGTSLRSKVFVFRRAAQGSRGAPLLWGRVAAHMNRLSGAMSPSDSYRASIYVDDPILIATGTDAETKRKLARVVAMWLARGPKLACDKRPAPDLRNSLPGPLEFSPLLVTCSPSASSKPSWQTWKR